MMKNHNGDGFLATKSRREKPRKKKKYSSDPRKSALNAAAQTLSMTMTLERPSVEAAV
jgi:hypothetical protein